MGMSGNGQVVLSLTEQRGGMEFVLGRMCIGRPLQT